jgi:hypothetical protein
VECDRRDEDRERARWILDGKVEVRDARLMDDRVAVLLVRRPVD